MRKKMPKKVKQAREKKGLRKKKRHHKPGEAVDPALDQNEAELGVLVLAVALEMLPHL
jgi:hypothetical protein